MIINKLKLYLFVIIAALFYSCGSNTASVETKPNTEKIIGDPYDNLRYDSAGTITEKDLTYLRENFNWNGEDILIINYTLTEASCKIPYAKPSEPEARFKRARTWWEPFYQNIETYDAKIVHVEASERFARAFITYSDSYYWDEDGFLLKHFYRNPRGCEAAFVVNRLGQFYQQNEHYTQEQVAFYVAKLKNMVSTENPQS